LLIINLRSYEGHISHFSINIFLFLNKFRRKDCLPYEALAKYGGRHWVHLELLGGANSKNNLP